MQSSRRRYALLLGIVFVVELVFALYTPTYVYPDERSHLQCISFYREEGRMPDPYTRGEKIQQDKHPPYLYVLGAMTLAASDGMFEDAEFSLPGPYERRWQLGRQQTVRVDAGARKVADGQLLLLRFAMLLHWMLAAAFFLACADLVFGAQKRWAFAMALGAATLPQAALGGAAVTPDTPLIAFCAGAWFYLLRAMLDGTRLRHDALWGGAFFALALLSKAAAVFFVPVVLVAGLRIARREGVVSSATEDASTTSGLDWRRGLLFVGLFAAIPVVLAAWWYLRNLVLYGDLFQMRAQVEAYTHSMRREPLSSTFFESLLWDLFRTFFGFFDRSTLLPRPLILVWAGLCGAAAIGLLTLLRRDLRGQASERERAVILPALVGFGVILTLTVVGNVTVPSAQGRYLYPALPGAMLLLGSGWRLALRRTHDGRGVYGALAIWILIGLWGLQWAIVRRDSVQRARRGGESVLFYEDCGSVGLHPHRVQGYDAPDQGQLGRVVPWRTVDGHPEAVVYRFDVPKDRDLQVRVTYFNPDPNTPYVAEAKGRFEYVTQRLFANGVMLHDDIELTGKPRELFWRVRKKHLASGKLELRFVRRAGVAASVAEIWIEEPWLDVRNRRVRNDGPRAIDALVLWARAAKGSETPAEGLARLALPSGDEAQLPAEVPSDATRIEVLGTYASPWMLREAEAHPVLADDRRTGPRWLGALEASGGYFMHGRGVIARLPFATDVTGPRMIELWVRSAGVWAYDSSQTRSPPFGSAIEYSSPSAVDASIDFAVFVGGWRP